VISGCGNEWRSRFSVGATFTLQLPSPSAHSCNRFLSTTKTIITNSTRLVLQNGFYKTMDPCCCDDRCGLVESVPTNLLRVGYEERPPVANCVNRGKPDSASRASRVARFSSNVFNRNCKRFPDDVHRPILAVVSSIRHGDFARGELARATRQTIRRKTRARDASATNAVGADRESGYVRLAADLITAGRPSGE
jgi:hypothetical protein